MKSLLQIGVLYYKLYVVCKTNLKFNEFTIQINNNNNNNKTIHDKSTSQRNS